MKKAKLFQNGQSQAVRLPKDFRFSGHEVYIKKIGHSTLLIPIEDPWKDWKESLNMFSSDFMTERKQPPMQERDLI